MKNIIVIDIGTHQAQEYRALFERSVIGHLIKIARRWGGHLLGRGDLIDFHQSLLVVKNSRILRKSRSRVFYVFIEPNPRLFALPIYAKSDLSFNIALSSDANICSLRPLYFANNDESGQGSSLFLEKNNVEETHFIPVINIDSTHFALHLKDVLDRKFDDGYSVILRINNEGAESDVIYAFENVFSASLKAVLGSLKDTAQVKGDSELENLISFLAAKDIKFIDFSPSVLTWPNSMNYLSSLLKISEP